MVQIRAGKHAAVATKMLLVFGLSFGLVAIGGAVARNDRQVPDRTEYRRLKALRDGGSQLVLVYIGSARCRWCKEPSLRGYIVAIRDTVAREASRRGLQFTTAGVAVDMYADEGLGHLRHLGAFDEVSSGGSWLNDVAVKYVWDGYGAPASTPQVLIIQRNVVRARGADLSAFYRVENEQLLARKTGLHEISSWVQSGVPLPRTDPATSALPDSKK